MKRVGMVGMVISRSLLTDFGVRDEMQIYLALLVSFTADLHDTIFAY